MRLVKLGPLSAAKYSFQVKVGTQLLQLCRGHLVVDLGGIATLHSVHRGLGQFGFQRHHGLGIGRSLVGRLSQQLKHSGHVLKIGFAQLDRLVVGLQIVVAVGKSQAALIGAGNFHHGIFSVGLGAKGKQRIHAAPLQVSDERRQLSLVRRGRLCGRAAA